MLILCYHELAEDEQSLWVLKPQTFAEHLSILDDRGYQFEALPREATAESSADKRVVITFDDGTIGCLRHAAPLLARFNIRAWFYICTGFTNGSVSPRRPTSYMSWSDVQELAQTHEIGAHSLTHPVFDDLPRDQRLQELAGSKAILEDRLGRRCPDFATPFGHVDQELIQLAQIAGFSTLVTTEFWRNQAVNPYRLQRWEVHSPGTRADFCATLDELERTSRTHDT